MEAGGLEAHRPVCDQVRGIDGHLVVIVGTESGDAAHVKVIRRLAQNAGQVAPINQVVLSREGTVGKTVLPQDLCGDALPKAGNALLPIAGGL